MSIVVQKCACYIYPSPKEHRNKGSMHRTLDVMSVNLLTCKHQCSFEASICNTAIFNLYCIEFLLAKRCLHNTTDGSSDIFGGKSDK